MAKLEPLLSLRNVKVGDLFTLIDTDNEDSLLQFVCRDPNLNPNSPFYETTGYVVELCGKHRMFRLTDTQLQLGEMMPGSKKPKYYIGYDEEFVLEERIKTLQGQLNTLQDLLAHVREMKPKEA